jgi:hypothetical protein
MPFLWVPLVLMLHSRQRPVRDIPLICNGSEGTISGIQFGATIKEVLNKVIKPENAVINVIDISDNLVPLQIRNFNKTYVDTKASNSIYFEVLLKMV